MQLLLHFIDIDEWKEGGHQVLDKWAGIHQADPTVPATFLSTWNLAFAGASDYKRGLLSFKHSSVDGQSASLTDLYNGEQVNK